MPQRDPPLRIVRDIPLWSVLTTVGVVIFQAAAIWLQMQASVAKQTEIAADIRTVREKVDAINALTIKLDARVESMERRISALENQQYNMKR